MHIPTLLDSTRLLDPGVDQDGLATIESLACSQASQVVKADYLSQVIGDTDIRIVTDKLRLAIGSQAISCSVTLLHRGMSARLRKLTCS